MGTSVGNLTSSTCKCKTHNCKKTMNDAVGFLNDVVSGAGNLTTHNLVIFTDQMLCSQSLLKNDQE